ncbi:hypothetical protein HHL16_20260 [Pseudoflavitalea sp. G-6-1-2]|uniref:hypothetical protein n=1 Tax=Pseudoflavitalea sp. G-6-1-2 TaxID=2728841 RepID=UPI001469BF60|nr:hypothetical protein [Pseudoflavitalea sp. G-6-1-2]NML23223.1 hypothetical protein [Pseudoflavitalea sp. G-6-1-2]
MRKVLLLLILTGSACVSNAQFNGQASNNFPTFKSPNVASMMKYLDVPVNLYTGQVGAGVPLYTVQAGDITIPISLSYSNTGLKLADIPSWVGHGWDLQVGGVVTQQVRGLPDDDDFGMLRTQNERLNAKKFETLPSYEKGNFFQLVDEVRADIQHDVFSFSFLGQGGTFYIDQNGQCEPLTNNNLKISFTSNPNGGLIEAFTIKDENGFVYLFNVRETTITDIRGPKALSQFNGSSWYLSKVTSPKGNIVEFTYTQGTITTSDLYQASRYSDWQCHCLGEGLVQTASKTQIPNYLLNEIRYNNNKVVFKAQTSREDVRLIQTYNGPGINWSNALDMLEVYNSKGMLIKAFDFTYDNNPSRLMLKKVQERSIGQPVSQGQSYQFEYYEGSFPMPSLDRRGNSFFQQDHWGYFNGFSNSSLVPAYSYQGYPGTNNYDIPGAERRAVPSMSIAGMLKSIQYPTGGNTIFEYEPNQITYSSPQQVPSYLKSGIPAPPRQFLWQRNYTASQQETIAMPENGNIYITEIWVYNESDPKPSISYNGLYIDPRNINEFTEELSPGVLYVERNYRIENVVAGNHAINIESTGDNQRLELTVEHATVIPNAPVILPVGGHRIKKMTFNSVGSPSYFKEYFYNNYFWRGTPDYLSKQDYEPVQVFDCIRMCGSIYTISNSNALSTSGSPIKYLNVTERYGDQGKAGEIRYEFAQPQVEEVDHYPYFFIDLTRAEHEGQLLSKGFYEKLPNGAYRIISKEYKNLDLSYSGAPLNTNYSYSLKDVFSPQRMFPEFPNTFGSEHDTQLSTWLIYSQIRRYSLLKFYSRILSDGQIQYSYIGNSETPAQQLTTQKNYFYDGVNKVLPSRIEEINSKNQTKITELKYPQDLSFTDPVLEAARLKMIQQNMVAAPLQTTETIAGNKVSETKTEFKEWNGGLLLPASVSTTIGNSTDAQTQLFINYDAKGNLLSQAKKDNVESNYIWDDAGIELMAEIVNAKNNQSAYTSFELNSAGNWNIASAIRNTTERITGTRSYDLINGNLSRNNLTSGKTYIISYWSKNLSAPYTIAGGTATTKTGKTVNGWKYYQQEVTLNSTSLSISGSGLIDELRLYPKDAQMKSFTSEPLIGITSMSDLNGNISYYEYDQMQRLKRVRDTDGNILKEYDYKYQTPVTP